MKKQVTQIGNKMVTSEERITRISTDLKGKMRQL